MNMLASHLQQISLSAEAIAELPFSPPEIFTNALLHPHDITTLIRDTEAHERALFTVAPPETGSFESKSSRRTTVFRSNNINGDETDLIGAYKGLRPTTAVRRVLGGDFMEQIRRGTKANGRGRNEVDVELLLNGAEKLCGIYPIEGATEKIRLLRKRHDQLTSSIEEYESRIARQNSQLDRMNRRDDHEDDDEEEGDDEHYSGPIDQELPEQVHVTAEDIEREEEEVRELDKQKRVLLDRVSSMNKDLGGIYR